MNECPQWILDRFDNFISLSCELMDSHPYIIVILMHEYMRSLYPNDKYIERYDNRHPLDISAEVLENNIGVLEKFAKIGSYRSRILQGYSRVRSNSGDKVRLVEKTGNVYGALWREYPGNMVDEAKNIIGERFSSNGVSLDIFKGKKILDAGCGSGRYTCAIAELGPQEVIGLDYGEEGIDIGKMLADKRKIDNVHFQIGSLLEMPFSDEEFDFVFANGVFHHTGNIKKGTEEFFRVMKKGGKGWYFIYGDGGLYWYSRKIMNTIMKKIPQDYAIQVLKTIGMPMNRFIFCDNWYVPIENHTSNDNLLKMFSDIGFSEYFRAYKGRETDFDYLVITGGEKDRQLWGDGNLRYFVTK